MDAVEYSPEAFFFFFSLTDDRMKFEEKKLISEIFTVASSWPVKSFLWPPAWSSS